MTDERRFVLYRNPNASGVVDAILDHLRGRYRQLEDGQAIEVLVRPKRRNRSLAQNRLLWGVLYKEIAEFINESQGTQFSDEDIHEWCRQQFLDSHIVEIRGDPVRARKSTASLSVEQMTDYIDRIYHWAATSLGVQLSEPEDLMAEAYGRTRNVA